MGKWARTLRVAIATTLVTLAVPVALVATAEPAAATTCAAVSQGIGWTSCDQTNDYGSYVRERVTYELPDSSSVNGWVCRPEATGNYPIMVINHSGFEDDDTWTLPTCKAFAATGRIAIASDYRPFAGGPSDDILCDGEVDDVLAMLDIIKLHPDADEDRVLMRGTSHGGCVTLRAYQRGVDGLVAAAAIVPPTDMSGEWQYLEDQLDPFNLTYHCGIPLLRHPNCALWQDLQNRMEQATGGTPSTAGAEYLARSVDSDLSGLQSGGVPLLISFGVDDPFVSPALTCATVADVNALTGAPDLAAYHFTSAGTTLTATAPANCPGFTWNTASNPTTTGYPLGHYFFAYAGYGHGDGTTTVGSLEYKVYDHANQFLISKL